jgi:hypothetical protein
MEDGRAGTPGAVCVHLMKIRTIPIIIVCLFSCATQSEAIENWFPDDITNLSPIDEYIYNFSAEDINVAREAYVTVLVFIREVIDACHENLERAYRLDSPTAKRPAIINGILTIIEDTDMTMAIIKWDEIRMERVEVVSVYVSWEFVLIIEYSKLYNNLLNYWLSLTGELLGQHIDVEIVHKKLFKDYALLLEPRCFEVF